MTHPALTRAFIEPEVHRRHPDYLALLMTVEGIRGGPSNALSEAAMLTAEDHARSLLEAQPLDEIPQIVQWREAYRSFGVKPRKARSSVESLLRRAVDGLPRIDLLTDLYNAVSVLQMVPIGGEDLDHYVGPPRLVVATGDELFETIANGQAVMETAAPGEIVWRDDHGVTCRRWNWRQCTRTHLTESTTDAIFFLDGLAATGRSGLLAAADDLAECLATVSPDARIETRVLGAE